MARAFGDEFRLEPDEVEFWQATYAGAVASGQRDASRVADAAVMMLRKRLDLAEAPVHVDRTGAIQMAQAELVNGIAVVRGFMTELRVDRPDPVTGSRGKASVEFMFDRGGKTRMEFALGPAVDTIYELMNARKTVGIEVRLGART